MIAERTSEILSSDPPIFVEVFEVQVSSTLQCWGNMFHSSLVSLLIDTLCFLCKVLLEVLQKSSVLVTALLRRMPELELFWYCEVKFVVL